MGSMPLPLGMSEIYPLCVCVCVCVCVICTFDEVDPYAAMRWQVYSAQSAVASLRL